MKAKHITYVILGGVAAVAVLGFILASGTGINLSIPLVNFEAQPTYLESSIKNIATNPDAYNGKYVKVTGELVLSERKDVIGVKDRDGNIVRLTYMSNRNGEQYLAGPTYVVEGYLGVSILDNARIPVIQPDSIRLG